MLRQRKGRSTGLYLNSNLRQANDLEKMWDTASTAYRHSVVRSVVHLVTVSHERIDIELSEPNLKAILNGNSPAGNPHLSRLIALSVPARLTSLGKEKRLIIEGAPRQQADPNPELIRAVALGHVWHRKVVQGEFTQKALAEHLDLAEAHVARYVQLGLLAPDIVEAILDGNQPLGLTVAKLYQVSSTDWHDQRRQLGFAA